MIFVELVIFSIIRNFLKFIFQIFLDFVFAFESVEFLTFGRI